MSTKKSVAKKYHTFRFTVEEIQQIEAALDCHVNHLEDEMREKEPEGTDDPNAGLMPAMLFGARRIADGITGYFKRVIAEDAER